MEGLRPPDNVIAFRARQPEGISMIPPLAQEVHEIRKAGRAITDQYLLPGTGMDVRAQISLFMTNIRNGMSFADAFSQIEQDVQGFKTEYLQENPLFGFPLERVTVNGRDRIAAPLYGGKLWADATSAEERDGTVKRAITGDPTTGKVGIEEFLLKKRKRKSVLQSTHGWSGYKHGGKDYKYQDTQIYAVSSDDNGKIYGFTIKCSLDHRQNERLLEELGQGPIITPLDERERIKNIINHYVLLEPEDNKGSVEWIINKVREIQGTDVAFVDSKGRPRTFTEALNQYKHPEKLWQLDDATQLLLNKYREFALYELENGADRQNLEIGLGRIVLELSHVIRGSGEEDMKEGQTYPVHIQNRSTFNPKAALSDMQKISGCAGGGQSKTIDSLTKRTATTTDTEYFTCPDCHYKADGPIGNKCPGCGLTKEKYTERTGVICA